MMRARLNFDLYYFCMSAQISYNSLKRPSGQNREITVWRSAILLIRHSKYSAILSIHSYTLLFRFCPLGYTQFMLKTVFFF